MWRKDADKARRPWRRDCVLVSQCPTTATCRPLASFAFGIIIPNWNLELSLFSIGIWNYYYSQLEWSCIGILLPAYQDPRLLTSFSSKPSRLENLTSCPRHHSSHSYSSSSSSSWSDTIAIGLEVKEGEGGEAPPVIRHIRHHHQLVRLPNWLDQ